MMRPAVYSLGLLLLAWSVSALAAPDPQALLARSDHARGGNLLGIVWEITLTSHDGERVLEPQHLRVEASRDASVAETLEPARFKGSRLLQVGRNMWLDKPGLSKPIPISPRQRMSGQASNGDIAATDYAGDYRATLAGQAKLDGVSCYVLDLVAKHNRTTYDRIRYWVSASGALGLKAEFYSVSGKLLKTARFVYGNTIEYLGHRIPFVSRMDIRDALTPAETVMTYSKVQVRAISPAEFDLGQMQ